MGIFDVFKKKKKEETVKDPFEKERILYEMFEKKDTNFDVHRVLSFPKDNSDGKQLGKYDQVVYYLNKEEQSLYVYIKYNLPDRFSKAPDTDEFLEYDTSGIDCPVSVLKITKEGDVFKSTDLDVNEKSTQDLIAKLEVLVEAEKESQISQIHIWQEADIGEPDYVDGVKLDKTNNYHFKFCGDHRFESETRAVDELYNRKDAYFYDRKNGVIYHCAMPMLGDKYHPYLGFDTEVYATTWDTQGHVFSGRVKDPNMKIEKVFQAMVAEEYKLKHKIDSIINSNAAANETEEPENE